MNKFIIRINSTTALTKITDPEIHICAFFLPLDINSKTIYLGHHIKANDWIPPGGHIEEGELPIDTVRREFYEELHHKLTSEKIKLFDLSIKDVSGNPKHKCKIHFDFWYIVYINKKNFLFDRHEFYHADWHSFAQAKKKMKLKQYNKIVQKAKSLL